MKLFFQSVKKLFIFFFIFGFLFSNLPFDFLSKVVSERNIVDKMWRLQGDANIVDRFIPLGQALQKLKINEAQAAVANNGTIMKGNNASAGTFYFMTVTSPNTFGAETTTALTSSASGLAHVVVKASPVQDEKLSGHLKADGRLDVARGIAGNNAAADFSAQLNVAGVSAALTCDATIGACQRPFDIAYEQLSGQGMVAYGKNATAGTVFYNIWNGSAWAGELSVAMTGSTGAPQWVRLIAEGEQLTNRRSDRILLLMMDANSDIFAAVWSGSAWGNQAIITTATSLIGSRTFDGAWENNSGDALVVYAEGAANSTTPFKYKQFVNGTSIWDATGTTIGTWTTSIGRWVALATNPVAGRDDIGVIMQASDATTITTSPQTRPFIWSGSAMTAGNALTAAESMVGANIGVAFEKLASTGEAVFVYTASDGTVDTSAYQTWISGTGFSASADITGAMADDSNNVAAVGSPNSSEIRIMGMTIDKAVQSQRWSGTAWNAAYSAALGTVVFPGLTNANQEAFGYNYAWTPYSPWTQNWRWYDDEGSATPATALANENTTASVSNANIVRLRFQAAELGGNAATASRKKLQYTSCATPDILTCTWTDVDAQAGAGIWRYADGAGGVDDATFTTTVLTGSDATGVYVENGTAASTFGHGANGTTSDIPEWDYTIQNNGATNGTTYYFRMWANDQNLAILRNQTNNSTTYSYPSATAAAVVTTLTISASAGSKVANVDSGATSAFVHNTGCTTDGTCAAFKLAASGGAANVISITVTETNASLNADIDLANAALIYDTDANYSNGTAGTFGTDATFTSQAVTFTNAGLSIPNASTYYFYIRTDFANGTARPDGGLTVNFQIASASDVISDATESGSGALVGTTTILPNVTSLVYPVGGDGGRNGDTFTIYGAGFGTSCANATTTIGSLNLTCVSASDTVATTTIPSGQTTTFGGTSQLLMTVGGTADNASSTFYIYPNIISITGTPVADGQREGSNLDINGTRFDAVGNQGTVDFTGAFGTVSASIISWSDTLVTVTVPANISDSVYLGDITLTRAAATASKTDTAYGGNTFRILPRIISTGPVDAKGGQSQAVTIAGNHFCQDGTANCGDYATDSDDATFNGVSAKSSYTSVSDTSISLSVPATATDGNLIVTSDSANGGTTYTSNNYSYNVKFGPSTPSGSSVGGSNNPTATSTAFSDGTDGDTHYKTNWQMAYNSDGDWSTPEWEASSTSALVSVVVNTTNGVFKNSDAGNTQLTCGTTYKGRVRHMDNGNGNADTQTWEWSSYSSDYTFTTASCNSLTAGISGTATSSVVRGVTANYMGGAFTLTTTNGAATITSIKISEINGTFVAYNNLNNVKLYYDTDGTYSGGETQLGSTQTSFASGDTVTFSGLSLGITNTAITYIYVVSDIDGDPVSGQLIDLEITNPSTDVSVTGAANTDTAAKNITGTTSVANPNITVSVAGSQTANLTRGSTANYVGGSFVLTMASATGTLTSFAITDNGTVNANSNLNNAKLYYDTDGTYSGGETQLGSTQTFNASEKATFSSLSLNLNTSATYIYVIFDVNSAVTAGQNIEIRVAASGDVSGTGFNTAGTFPLDISGTTNIIDPSLTVSTSGTQAVNLDAGATNQHIGGASTAAFTLQIGGASATVTTVKITDNGGTVTFNNLTSPKLYYENAATCAYNANESNVTGTYTGETVSFSLPSVSVGVSPNYTCLYFVSNVASTTVGGQTIDVEVSNPSTDVVISGATNTDASAKPISGATTIRPNVTSINYPQSPDGGRNGNTFTIYGAGFGTSCANATTTIGSLNLTCVSVNNTVATTTIPSGQTTTFGGTSTNGLLLTVGGTADDARQDFYIYPNITSITGTPVADGQREGSNLDINGTRFDAVGNQGTVDFTGAFGTVSAAIVSWSDTLVTVTVPVAISNSVYLGDITLTRAAATASKTDTAYGGNTFRILPKIASLNPSSGAQNNALDVAGDHFCQAGSASCPGAFSYTTPISNVLFGATNALNPASWYWTNTTSSVKVPSGSGVVAVKLISGAGSFDYESNTSNFSYLSTTPATPDTLEQFKSDGITSISVGGGTSGSSVILEGNSTASTSISMFMEVEVRATSTSFTGTPTASSSVQGPGTTFNNVAVTVSGLTDSQYYWQARAKNSDTGEVSNWVSFGGNADGQTDFYVDSTGPVISNVAVPGASLNDIQATITWNTDESATQQVAYGTSCPTGQADAAATFTALTTKQPANPAGTGTSHSVVLSNLVASTVYYYMVRSADDFSTYSYNPATANSCNNFTTAAPQTRLMKTLEFYIQQSTSTGSTFSKDFDVFVSESKADRSNIFFKSVAIETFGVVVGDGSGNITVDANLNSNSTVYTLTDPGNNVSAYWTLTNSTSSLNFDCSNCTDNATTYNTLSVTVSGATNNSLLGAKAIITYYYVPQ